MENPQQIFWTLIAFVVIKMSTQQDVTAEMDQYKFFFQNQGEFPKDCQDVKDHCTQSESRVSGVYLIKPEGYEEPFEVFCDHETDGGGWTVFQRRQDKAINFARPWKSYKEGFGFLNREFWLGNDKLAYLTNQKKYVLRIDLRSRTQMEWVYYNHFRITDEKGFYKLVKLGDFSSSNTEVFGNVMISQKNMPFSTSDNFTSTISSCPRNSNAGGWWFTGGCRKPNLNGQHLCRQAWCLHWHNEEPPLIFSEMKIKPADVA